MQEFNITIEEADSNNGSIDRRQQMWSFVTYLVKRVVVLISFGPGVVGLLWLLGRIFKKR